MSAGPTTDKGFYRDTNLFQYTHSNHKQGFKSNSKKSLLTPEEGSDLQLSKSKSKASKGSYLVNNFNMPPEQQIQFEAYDGAIAISKPPRSPEKVVQGQPRLYDVVQEKCFDDNLG